MKTMTPGVGKLPSPRGGKLVTSKSPVSKGGGNGQIWKGSKPTGGRT